MAQTPAERRKAQRANAKALKAGGSRIAGMGSKMRGAVDRARDSRRVISLPAPHFPAMSSGPVNFKANYTPKHGSNPASHVGANPGFDSDSKSTSYVGKRRSGVVKVGSISAGAHRRAA